MIDREDMLALTRRMTVKRTSMTRIAGGYMDSDGCIDGTFNIAFLKLSPADREKNLQIAKKVPFAETNQNLQEYKFLQENMQNDSLWKLLIYNLLLQSHKMSPLMHHFSVRMPAFPSKVSTSCH